MRARRQRPRTGPGRRLRTRMQNRVHRSVIVVLMYAGLGRRRNRGQEPHRQLGRRYQQIGLIDHGRLPGQPRLLLIIAGRARPGGARQTGAGRIARAAAIVPRAG